MKIKYFFKTSLGFIWLAGFLLSGVFFTVNANASKNITEEGLDRILESANLSKNFVYIETDEETVAVNRTELKKAVDQVIYSGKTDITYGGYLLVVLYERRLIESIASREYVKKADKIWNLILDINVPVDVSFEASKELFTNLSQESGGAVIAGDILLDSPDYMMLGIELKTLKGLLAKNQLRLYFKERFYGAEPEEAILCSDVFSCGSIDNETKEQYELIWQKWGEYFTPNGVKDSLEKETKKKIKNNLVLAVKKQRERQNGQKEQSFSWGKKNFFKGIKRRIVDFISVLKKKILNLDIFRKSKKATNEEKSEGKGPTSQTSIGKVSLGTRIIKVPTYDQSCMEVGYRQVEFKYLEDTWTLKMEERYFGRLGRGLYKDKKLLVHEELDPCVINILPSIWSEDNLFAQTSDFKLKGALKDVTIPNKFPSQKDAQSISLDGKKYFKKFIGKPAPKAELPLLNPYLEYYHSMGKCSHSVRGDMDYGIKIEIYLDFHDFQPDPSTVEENYQKCIQDSEIVLKTLDLKNKNSH